MNCVRIAIVGFLVDRFGIEQAEGFLHFFEGWIIFIACIVALYLVAAGLQLLTRPRQSVHSMLEIDFPALAAQFGRLRSIQPNGALIFSVVIVSLAAVAWYATPARPAIDPVRDPLVLFPMEVGDWRGDRSLIEPEIEQVLGADDYLVANYRAPGAGASVNLFVAYYRSQTEGSGIHSPEVCLPTGGWEVSRWTPTNTGVASGGRPPLSVNRAVIQRGLSRQLVYYWFEQRGRQITGDYAAKMYTLWDSITRSRTDGALVRLVTPISPGEGANAADERLRAFLGLIMPELQAYVPG